MKPITITNRLNLIVSGINSSMGVWNTVHHAKLWLIALNFAAGGYGFWVSQDFGRKLRRTKRSAAAIIGWRAWDLFPETIEDGEITWGLSSITRSYRWKPREAATGNVGAGLGIFAHKNRKDADDWAAGSLYCAVGTVALWGNVEEHRDGWRAEFGYPVRVIIKRNAKPIPGITPADMNSIATKMARDIANRYGVDVDLE